MVAVAAPIWAVAGRDNALGDVQTLTGFIDWSAEVGFTEVVLLPIHPHVMDLRLHALRHMLFDCAHGEDVLTNWKIAVDTLFDEFVELFQPLVAGGRGGVFLFERCPYYSTSAFAVSPLWCSLEPRSDAAVSIVDYFGGLHAACGGAGSASGSPSSFTNKGGAEESSVLFVWARVWLSKTIALADRFAAEAPEVKYRAALLRCAQKHASSGPSEDGPLSPTAAVGDDAFLAWVEQNAEWALSYALWEALADANAYARVRAMAERGQHPRQWPACTPPWSSWEVGVRKCGEAYSPELLCAVLAREDVVSRNFVFALWSQFMIEQDWEEKLRHRRTELVGDIPIYVPTCSADVWARPEIFGVQSETRQPKTVSGLPPDYWSSEGQLWGTPTYDWQIERQPVLAASTLTKPRVGAKTFSQSCYRYWRERLARQLRLFDRVRIDHYRAFADYWGVEADANGSARSSTTGRWLEGPGSALFISLLSDLRICSTRLIVEDLGEETALFAELRNQLPFVNMAVLQFVLEAALVEPATKEQLFAGLMPQRSSSLLFTSTHDTPPLQSWVETLGEAQKKRLSLLTGLPAPVLNSCVAGRYVLGWLIDSNPWLKQRNSRHCFCHAPRAATELAEAHQAGDGSCLAPMSALCIQLQDLLSLSDRINTPGQISGLELWSWTLASADWKTLTSQPFVQFLARKLAR